MQTSNISIVRIAQKAVAAAALGLFTAANGYAGTLFIGGWDTDKVYSVDLTAQTVSPLGGPSYPLLSGMEGIGNDLYVFDQTSDIVSKINPVTGAVLTTYNLGGLGINVVGEGTFAMNSDLTGFVSSSAGEVGTYWTFNLNTMTSAFIGTGISFDGVDYAPNGTLYGLTQASSTPGGAQLHTINPLTGVTSFIGSTGISTGSLGAFVVAEGDFIAAIGDSLYRLNPATAAPTLLFNPGIGDISGAAYLGSTDPILTPVPEPSTYAMMLAGLGLLGFMTRRRKVVKS